MKTYGALTAAAFLLGMISVSHGGQITSPPLWTSTDTAGACYIRNVGTTPISVQVQTLQSVGFEIRPDFQNCNGTPLAAGATCVLRVDDLPDAVDFVCSATARNVADLRGTIEVRAITPGGLKVNIAENLR